MTIWVILINTQVEDNKEEGKDIKSIFFKAPKNYEDPENDSATV